MEVEREEDGGEEEVAHELGLDGEAVGVRKAEGLVGAAGTKQGGFAGEAGEVEEALEPAEGGDEEAGTEVYFDYLTFYVLFRNEFWNCQEGKAEAVGDPGGEQGAEGIGGPEDGEVEVEGEGDEEGG